MPFSLEELTIENIAIFHIFLSFSLPKVVEETTLICLTIFIYHFSLATCLVIHKLSFINVSIGKC